MELGMTPRRLLSALLIISTLLVPTVTVARTNPKIGFAGRSQGSLTLQRGPVVDYVAHSRGNIQLAVANNGTFGTLGSEIVDPITGGSIPSCIYPRNSDFVYLWVAAVWIGAVVGRDTLVSVGNEDFYRTTEFWPTPYDAETNRLPKGFKMRSIDINSPFYDERAVSEEDIICEYADTLDDPAIVQSDPNDNRGHKPLGVKITQRSMAWSYSYADDFILFDFQVENILEQALEDVYIGVYVDGDVWHTTRNSPEGWNDDIVGFYPEHPAPEGCGFIDTINVAYHADNDGDPVNGAWDFRSPRSAVGVRVVRTPAEEPDYSYNWWIINYSNASRDFGPRQRGTPTDPYRDLGTRMGTPLGDRNKYYLLRHEEFDYDLLFTGTIGPNDPDWLQPPPDEADSFATGFDCRYLLSFGPFDISPGQKLPVSFAWLGGENFHTDPNAFVELFNPNDPVPYYNYLGFENLAENSRWASWVYDNPGVDTDGDGYFGKFRICSTQTEGVQQVNDTSWYEGDGIPDFRGAGPPPAPFVKVLPTEDKLTVRFNGYFSETTDDVFLGDIDFEGYRIYIARDDRPSSFSLLASYDKENFTRWTYDTERNEWVVKDIPFTLDSLRSLYNDPNFDPLTYTRESPLRIDGQQFYFAQQDFNNSDLSDSTAIYKAYPEATDPGTNPDLWDEEDLTYLHGQPLPKYYEYEFVIEDLLQSVPYYVAVTSFDFGSPRSGLPALETKPVNNYYVEYPQFPADSVTRQQLDVYVYPNPYRIDGGYRRDGYEGRLSPDRPDDRVRALHFANLPPKCKISIYTVDGDLVDSFTHDKNPSDPQSAHNQWDLITRNVQSVVSGLYFYVVESEDRTQIGKFAVIR